MKLSFYSILCLCLFITGCSSAQPKKVTKPVSSNIVAQPLSSKSKQAVSSQKGIASSYSDKFNGRRTASGETLNNKKLTAAHRSLPFGTHVRVTALWNNKSVIVRINDRGPFVKGRVIDISKAAAAKIGLLNKGLGKVKVEVLK
ncbi:hypothetical protein A1D22_10190 [Pasteurellaceae bacterium LFhippo2]|nr:hypothetical protein [Pasteurellaceae bacterium LFhippo2]